MKATPDKRRAELIAALAEARRESDFEGVITHADDLKALLPAGDFTAALREAVPDSSNPTQWLSRKRKQLAARQAKGAKAQVGTHCPTLLQDRAMGIYPKLAALQRLPARKRSRFIAAMSAETGLAELTIRRKLRALERGGVAALNRKPRSDRGDRRALTKDAEKFFLQLYTDKATRHLHTSRLIKRVRERFPEMQASDGTFYGIARTVAKALRMDERKWDATFLHQGEWDVPHPNHTHTFDMTIGDLYVWDGDPAVEPYRPNLTALVDEATQSCMFALYTKEPPNRATVQAVLFHAWLPKFTEDGKSDPRWPQCGAPRYLHCDNGKVQHSDWLKEVCETLGRDVGLVGEIRHSAVRKPQQQGHIERFFGLVHDQFEAERGCCYVGNDAAHKPACFVDPAGGIKVWRQYPTLDSLNAGLQTWIRHEFHQSTHRRLGMSRLEAWRLDVPRPVSVPDRDYLYQVLLQRDRRKIIRGQVQWENMFYWHPTLEGYEGRVLNIRWDPTDLSKVLVLGLDGQAVCWADRQNKRSVDSPQDLVELKQQKGEARREKQILAAAAAHAVTMDEGELRRRREAEDRARHDAGILAFPVKQRIEKPAEPDDTDAKQIIEMIGAMTEPKAEDEDRIVVHNLEP